MTLRELHRRTRRGGLSARPLRAFLGLAAAALVLLSASAASAQERIRLRAGEHAEFSRIALDVPQLAEWSIERNGRLVTVLFPDRELLFATEQIFPQRRISRVTSARSERGRDGTRLILSMSCNCVAEAYEFRPGMLVMDIRAQPEETEAGVRARDREHVVGQHRRDQRPREATGEARGEKPTDVRDRERLDRRVP